MANQPLPDPRRSHPRGPNRWVVLCEFAGHDAREWCRRDTYDEAMLAMHNLGHHLEALGDTPVGTYVPPAPIGNVVLRVQDTTTVPTGRTWPPLVFNPQAVQQPVDDHDHAGQVDAYGLCVTCSNRPAAPARAAADAAISAAGEAAPAEWYAAAQQAVRDLAAAGAEFTTDQVWQRLATKPPEPRALGAVMRWAADAGLIAATERTESSRRPESHANPKRVWKPL